MDDHDLWMAFFEDPDGQGPRFNAGRPEGLPTVDIGEGLLPIGTLRRSNHDPLDLIVRVEAWFAIAAAFSSVPPFLRQAVIPIARKL